MLFFLGTVALLAAVFGGGTYLGAVKHGSISGLVDAVKADILSVEARVSALEGTVKTDVAKVESVATAVKAAV
jgi:hypothetical protein